MDDSLPVPRGHLRALRELVALESFGGPAIFELLKSRNPEIDLILNAGIFAGALYTDVKEECDSAPDSPDPVP